MKIYLIGMPGAGKTVVGKALSDTLQNKLIDLDMEIEKSACMFIDEIFAKYGEKYFRDLETNVLKSFMDLDNVIISCGGGIVKNKSNKELMNGIVVLIDTDLDIISKRMESDDTVRPLLKTNSLASLYDERAPLYDYFSDLKVSNNGTINDTVVKIMEGIYEGINNQWT